MAISGVSGNQVSRVNHLLREIGRSIDADSQSGVRVSDGEAQKIVGELNKLPEAERKAVVADLQQLMQADFFTVTDGARALFAKEMGVEAKELAPRAKAELVGLAEEKSQFQMTVQRLAKPAAFNKAEMKNLVDKLEAFAPPEMQAQLAVTLQNAQKDGLISMDPGARREFVKFYGKQDVATAAKSWNELLDTKSSGQVDYIAGMMASGACFEDIVAAFMGHIVSKMQKEQLEKMKEMEENDQLTRTREALTKKLHKSMETGGVAELDEADKNQLGVLSKYGVDMNQDVPAGKTDAPAGEPEKPAAPTSPAAPEGPVAVGDTKEALTNLVTSVHGHLSDLESDGSTGIINRQEAMQIVRHLDALPPGVDTMVGQALANTLRHTEGMADKLADPKSPMAPIANWIREKLGPDVDLTPDPAYKPGSGLTSDVAKKLFYEGDKKKPRLENKLAAFLVDSLLVSEKNLSAKMQDLQGFTNELTKSEAAKQAFTDMVGEPPATDFNPKEALAAREGHPTAEVPQDAAQFGAKVGESLEQNLKYALDDAEKNGKPVTLWFNGQDITVKPGDKLDDVKKDVEARFGIKGDAKAEFTPSVMTAEEIESALKNLPEAKSREMMFEELKNLNNLLMQVMQALGNILNSMHQTAMNSIRAIR